MQSIATLEAGMSAEEPLGHGPPKEKHTQTHPLQHFPPELLEEIFQHCQEEQEDLSLTRPPWYLIHICQLWRQVALRMSALWRHLPPIYYQPKSKRPNVPKLQFLLHLSSNAKITFLLHQTRHLVPNGIIPLLLRHCHRWERVALYVSDYVCEILSRSTAGRLLSLTTLTIDIQSLNRPHSQFLNAPKLRALRYTGFVDQSMTRARPSTMLSGPLPWNLTSFTSHAVLLDTQTLLKVLTKSKNLKKLDVALRGLANQVHSIHPTTISSLNSLFLRFPPGPQVHESILSNFTLPSLTELYVGLYPPPRLLPDLAGMLARSMCLLQHMTLQSSIRHLKWAIADVLRFTPQLKSLTVSSVVDPRLVETLCLWNQAEGWTFVPFLETLTIYAERPCNLGRLAVARCDLAGESSPQVCQRLKNFFVVSSSPLFTLEDLRDIRVPNRLKYFFGRLADWLASDNRAFEEMLTRVDDLLSSAEGTTDSDEVLYLYYARINFQLWNSFFTVPLEFRLAWDLRDRLEEMFRLWADVVVNSRSHVRWIWDKNGYLKYTRDTPEDSEFLFFRLKRAFLEEEMPVDKDFPYEDDRPLLNS